jgi:hypothetical protein
MHTKILTERINVIVSFCKFETKLATTNIGNNGLIKNMPLKIVPLIFKHFIDKIILLIVRNTGAPKKLLT